MVRTVALLERAGADALQIEDQVFPKRCGHFAGKQVIPAAEMVEKIKAAVDTRRDRDLLIIARTDAIAPEGFEAALARAAPITTPAPTSPSSRRHLDGADRRHSRRLPWPQLLNIVIGGHPELPNESEGAGLCRGDLQRRAASGRARHASGVGRASPPGLWGMDAAGGGHRAAALVHKTGSMRSSANMPRSTDRRDRTGT